jgi:hypothetical protein
MFVEASSNFGARNCVAKVAFEYSLSLISNLCKCVITVVSERGNHYRLVHHAGVK